jgi:hypothetical protein
VTAAAWENPIEFRVGSIIGKSFQILRMNFWRFILIAAALQVLLLLLTNALGVESGRFNANFGYSYDSRTHQGGFHSTGLLSLLNFVIAGIAQLAVGGLLQFLSFHSLRQDGTSTGAALAKIGRRLGPMILTAIATYIIVLVGFILLIVPGILFALGLSVSITVCLMEDRGVGESLSRSRALTSGYRGRIFLAFLLFAVVSMIVVGIAALIAKAIGSIAVSYVLMILAEGLVTAFAASMIAAIYYNLRVLKDGVGISDIAAVFD